MKKAYSKREFEKLLRSNNYVEIRHRGSHSIFSNGIKTLSINLGNPNQMVMRRLINEYQLMA